MKAHELAQQAADILKQRGIENGYDAGEERSAAKIATVFNSITGHNLTEQDAWMFLICLKLVRQGRKHQTDNLLDLSNYALLLAESHGNPDIPDDLVKRAGVVTGRYKGGNIRGTIVTVNHNATGPVSHNDGILGDAVEAAVRRAMDRLKGKAS